MNETETYEEKQERWFLHSQQRAMDRYGMLFSKEDLGSLRSAVKGDEFKELKRIPDSTRSVLQGEFKGQTVTFVYCRRYLAVITFLHNKWITTFQDDFVVLRKERPKPRKMKRGIGKTDRSFMTNRKGIRKVKTPRKRVTSTSDPLEEYYNE